MMMVWQADIKEIIKIHHSSFASSPASETLHVFHSISKNMNNRNNSNNNNSNDNSNEIYYFSLHDKPSFFQSHGNVGRQVLRTLPEDEPVPLSGDDVELDGFWVLMLVFFHRELEESFATEFHTLPQHYPFDEESIAITD